MLQSVSERPHFIVIDPNLDAPDIECFNFLALLSPLPLTLHQPALKGIGSLGWENMSHVRGIIILGSAASVHDRSSWQLDLESWLQPQLRAGVPTLGFCYGHQMIAQMFGGAVEFMYPDRSERKGLHEVRFKATPWSSEGVGSLIFTHGEAVSRVPEDMLVFAASEELAIEGLCHKYLPIWTVQCHPEAVPAFLDNEEIKLEQPFDDALVFGHRLIAQFLDYARIRHSL